MARKKKTTQVHLPLGTLVQQTTVKDSETNNRQIQLKHLQNY